MAKSKKSSKKPSVKVRDLKAKKNPKGGAADIFAKLGDIKGESLRGIKGESLTSIKYSTALTDSALKIK